MTIQLVGGTTHKLRPRLFWQVCITWAHCRSFYTLYMSEPTPQTFIFKCKLCLTVLLGFQVCYHFWVVLPAKSSVAVLSAIHCTSHSKVQMAFSHHNSLTPVPPLGTPFNTILYFSDQMAYLPNTLWHSRWIHQRDCLSPRSSSSTIQPGRIVLPVPGPSIVSADNDPNWKDAPANPITNTTIANRPTSSTRSWSKPHQSNNTNE